MPFVPNENERQFIVNPDVVDQNIGEQTTTFFDDVRAVGDAIGTSFAMENSIVSGIINPREIKDVDIDFNPFEYAKEQGQEDIFTDFSSVLSESTNSRQYDQKITQINRENEWRKIQSASPWGAFTGGVFGGVLDWTSLLPAGTFIKSAKAAKNGYSLLKTGGSVAVATAAATSVQEYALQQTQATRTLEESYYNVAASTILGGTLGIAGAALFNRLGKGVTDDVLKKMSDDLNVPADGAPDKFDFGTSSVGAAQSDFGGSKLQSAMGVDKVVKFQDPQLRTLSSDNKASRKTMQEMAETVLTTEANVKGQANVVGGTVETRIKMNTEAAIGKSVQDTDLLFSKYRFGEKKFASTLRSVVQDKVGSSGGKLSRVEFNQQIAHALRNGDKHDIPEIQAAAKVYRDNIFNPAKEKAIELDLLPENVDVTTADSYLMRMWNKEGIRADEVSGNNFFVKKVADWLKSERQREVDELEFDETGQRLKEELSAVRRELNTANLTRKTTKAQQSRELARLREKERQAGARTKQSKADIDRAIKRKEELKPTEFDNEAEQDFFRELLKDLRRGRVKEKVVTPIQQLQNIGGIRDDGGELLNIIGRKGARPKLINQDSSLDIDDAGEILFENGFFSERPEINQTLDLIQRSHGGEVIPAPFDVREIDIAARQLEIESTIRELDELGFDYTNKSAVELMAFIKGIDFKKKGARSVGRQFENARAINRAIDRTKSLGARADKTADELDDLLILRRQFREGSEAFQTRTADLQRTINKLIKSNSAAAKRSQILQSRVARSDVELDDLAREIKNRILGHADGRSPYDLDVTPNTARGSQATALGSTFKGRAFNIPDSLVEEFIENDIEMVGRRYLNTMWGDIELTNRFGDVNMTRQIKEVEEEGDRLVSRATDEKSRKKQQKQKENDIRDIAAVRDRIRGTYGLPDNPDNVIVRAGRVVRSLNYLRLLGGMTLSAIPDMGRVVMVHGLRSTLGDGLVPLFTNFHKFAKARGEAKLAGAAWETITNSRVMAMADIMDDYGRHSKFERAVHGATTNFGIVSLMSVWNDAMKSFSAVVTQTNMLRATENLAKGIATPKEIKNLAASNIDANMARAIDAQFKQFGSKDGSVLYAGTKDWTDVRAVESFRTALLRDVDRIVVTPGVGDRPLWMSTELGKQIGQFKSFGISSVQRTMLSGLQQADLATLNGAMLMMALGGATHVLREGLAGREVDFDNKSALVVNAFDRSGLGGWFMEANGMAEKLTRGRIGASAFTGKKISRYQSRNIIGALIGPTAGAVKDFAQVTGSLFEGDWKESDTRAVRRILPYQNVFYLRNLLDKAEENLNRTIGVK